MKISSKIWLIAVCFLFGTSAAQAEDQNNVNCADQQTQFDMNYCAGLAYKAADGDLNTDYKVARDYMIEIDGYLSEDMAGAKQALLEAQRAWIKYRDLACNAEGFSVRGGTMEPGIVASCLERITRQRSEDLRRLYEIN